MGCREASSSLVARSIVNDPTQFEQVDETCEFGGAVLYSESLGITAFFENAVPSKYETQKLKQLQFGIKNEKIRQFEHECLIRLFQWSFLPPGKALDFSVCDEAFGCYKTQYRKRYLLEICQNASFLSTPDMKEHLLRQVLFSLSQRAENCRPQRGAPYSIAAARLPAHGAGSRQFESA